MAAATVKPSTLAKRSSSAAAFANSPNSTRTAILVYDFWEKLAGASLALASAVHLCRLARATLVQPFVESSMLVPFPGAGRLPLSAYYSVPHLQRALAPSSLLSIDEWERRVAAAAPAARTAVVVVWSEFPPACTSALSAATGLARCPSACVKRAEKELASKARTYAVRGGTMAMLQAVRCYFLEADGGESSAAAQPTWAPDDEPAPASIDSWSRGAVASSRNNLATASEKDCVSWKKVVWTSR